METVCRSGEKWHFLGTPLASSSVGHGAVRLTVASFCSSRELKSRICLCGLVDVVVLTGLQFVCRLLQLDLLCAVWKRSCASAPRSDMVPCHLREETRLHGQKEGVVRSFWGTGSWGQREQVKM